MYQAHFALREFPFELTSDPRYLYLTPRHQEALSNLQYGLVGAKALTLLIGEAGTGKTTLLHGALASDLCRNVRCIYVNNPALTRDEFVTTLARRFDLGPEAAFSKAVLLDSVERILRERSAAGEITALVVDEAQRLSVELLEELRLLANIETPSRKLLPLVLAGQPELATRLELPELRQLKQRVVLRCELQPFDLADTARYVAKRLQRAGGVPAQVFTREAIVAIHHHAYGIPRSINVICDNAMMSAYAMDRRPVDREIVQEVCRDLVLRPDSRPTDAAKPVQTSDRDSNAERGATGARQGTGAGRDGERVTGAHHRHGR
jgi:general secretion pathway protein A